MSSTLNRAADFSLRNAPPNLRIVHWPIRETSSARLTAALASVAAVFCGYASGSAAMGGLSFAALALAFWRLWVPVVYELGPHGIVESIFRRRRRISWRLIARCDIHSRGMLLLAENDSSPLIPLGGLFIHHCGKQQELQDVVSFYLAVRTQATPPSIGSGRTRTMATEPDEYLTAAPLVRAEGSDKHSAS